MSSGHRLAVANRSSLSCEVTDFIISKGEMEALRTIASNPGAAISAAGFEKLIDRAKKDEVLLQALEQREDLHSGNLRRASAQGDRALASVAGGRTQGRGSTKPERDRLSDRSSVELRHPGRTVRAFSGGESARPQPSAGQRLDLRHVARVDRGGRDPRCPGGARATCTGQPWRGSGRLSG
jgi:hypothetical protein